MSTLDRLSSQAADLARHLPSWATEPAMLVGALGLALLVAGQRLYRLAIVAPGLAAGVMAGLELSEGQPTELRVAAVAALAIVAAFLLHRIERMAVAAAGSFLAVGLARAGAPLVLDQAAPWYVLLGAGLLGLLLFPRLYERLLLVITPAIGAVCVAWAVDRPQDLLLIAGLTLAGTVVQLATGRGGGSGGGKAGGGKGGGGKGVAKKG